MFIDDRPWIKLRLSTASRTRCEVRSLARRCTRGWNLLTELVASLAERFVMFSHSPDLEYTTKKACVPILHSCMVTVMSFVSHCTAAASLRPFRTVLYTPCVCLYTGLYRLGPASVVGATAVDQSSLVPLFMSSSLAACHIDQFRRTRPSSLRRWLVGSPPLAPRAPLCKMSQDAEMWTSPVIKARMYILPLPMMSHVTSHHVYARLKLKYVNGCIVPFLGRP